MDAVSTTLLCPVPMPDLITYDITAEPRQGLVTLSPLSARFLLPIDQSWQKREVRVKNNLAPHS